MKKTFGSVPFLVLSTTLLVAACASPRPVPESTRPPRPTLAAPSVTPAIPPLAKVEPAAEPKAPVSALTTPTPALQVSSFDALPGWPQDDLLRAWSAFLHGCPMLQAQAGWQSVCRDSSGVNAQDRMAIRNFFESRFQVYRVVNPDGTYEGLVTGYYEPLVRGSRVRSARYPYPLYGVPKDLLVVDLATLYPDLKNMRLRGRLDGARVVPYYSRAEIETGAPLQGNELYWIDDIVEVFFLQIQGSGQIQLDDGSIARVGYADQNGHPYRSLARVLIDRGELPLAKTSMQGIKEWGRNNPAKLNEALNQNPSYVFFKELPLNLPGPLGTLRAPLIAEHAIAVDQRVIPLGAPVYLDTTYPATSQKLQRLVMAQDTGGAIRGAVRADFYWGSGDEAGKQAGRTKQKGRMWVLLPREFDSSGWLAPGR